MAIEINKIKSNEPTLKTGFKKHLSWRNFWQSLEKIGTIGNRDLLFFVQNLQVMIKSGLALDRSLKTLADQTKNKKFKAIINDLASQTEKGLAFNISLAKYPRIFGNLFISMVEAGGVSGRLEDGFKKIY